MAILDVIEFLDPTGKQIVHRVPEGGSGEFRLGSQAIVRESQVAVFFRDGRALDVLGPGRHTLSTANIPILAGLLSIPFGGTSPFRAEVVFVNMADLLDMKWGTMEPILFRDSEFGMVRLRAFGTYVAQVAEPRKLLTGVVGTRGRFTVQDLEEQLRSSIIARVADVIAERMRERKLSVLDLATEYDELSDMAHEALKKDFGAMGMELTRFYINTISVPEELERRLDQVGGVAAMGGMDDYTRFKAAEALQDAAKSGGNNLAGAGVGLGVGINLGAVMGQALTPTLQPQQPAPAAQPQGKICPKCNAQNVAAAKFCNECGTSLLPVACPKCGHVPQAGAKFCIECGTALHP